MLNTAYLKSDKTEKGDECFTPFYAVEPLLEFIPQNWRIWLPFDEPWSAFNRIFTKNGYSVIRSHINEGKDFFKYTPDFDVIISNPPFSKKDKVLERLYSLGKPFAVLLPVAGLQSKTRFKQFQKGLELLVFDGRIQYHTDSFEVPKKGVHFGSAYFCRGVLPEKLVFRELKPYVRQLK